MSLPETVSEFASRFQATFCNLHSAFLEFTPNSNFAFHGETIRFLNIFVKSYQNMFERFCPYKVGEEVELNQTLKVDDTGWRDCKHFLIEGATAVIIVRDFRDGKFRFYVKFNDDSWVDCRTGQINLREESQRRLFLLSEEFLRSKGNV